METNIAQIVHHVRAWIAASGRPNTHIAEQAGVDEKTIRLAVKPEWNPRVKTLGKLAAIVPADFQPKKRRAL